MPRLVKLHLEFLEDSERLNLETYLTRPTPESIGHTPIHEGARRSQYSSIKDRFSVSEQLRKMGYEDSA